MGAVVMIQWVVLVLFLFLLRCEASKKKSSFASCEFQTIFNFGDSNSDTGAISACFYRTLPPNGITYFQKPAGRACDGLLIIDHYGCWCKDMLPRMQDFSRALYTIDIGQNDLAFGFRSMPLDRVNGSVPDILAQLSSAIQDLYWQGGARSFWIHNTGPIGCLPYSVIFGHAEPKDLDPIGCIRTQNEIAQEFNKQLKEMVVQLRSDLPHAAITYVDIYSAKYALISQATNLGFVDPFKVCCGHAGKDYLVTCGNTITVNGSQVYGSACSDPLTHISWDGVHYSHSANQLIANQIINGSLSDPPIPLADACHRVE